MEIETVCNTSDDVLFANVEANSKRPIPWVRSVEAHEGQAVIVGGGPSAGDWMDEVRWRKSIGQTVFALNAAAKFLAENGIEADFQVIVDARDHNLAFLGHAKHHLLASQVHPSLFDAAKGVTLWHSGIPAGYGALRCVPAGEPSRSCVDRWRNYGRPLGHGAGVRTGLSEAAPVRLRLELSG
jgi:hypothetical protein